MIIQTDAGKQNSVEWFWKLDRCIFSLRKKIWVLLLDLIDLLRYFQSIRRDRGQDFRPFMSKTSCYQTIATAIINKQINSFYCCCSVKLLITDMHFCFSHVLSAICKGWHRVCIRDNKCMAYILPLLSPVTRGDILNWPQLFPLLRPAQFQNSSQDSCLGCHYRSNELAHRRGPMSSCSSWWCM